MATTTISKNIPVPKKRAQGLTVMVRTIINARTPLVAGCFYGVLFALLLAFLYPSITQAGDISHTFQALQHSWDLKFTAPSMVCCLVESWPGLGGLHCL